jgi:hypothetical protein
MIIRGAIHEGFGTMVLSYTNTMVQSIFDLIMWNTDDRFKMCK